MAGGRWPGGRLPGRGSAGGPEANLSALSAENIGRCCGIWVHRPGTAWARAGGSCRVGFNSASAKEKRGLADWCSWPGGTSGAGAGLTARSFASAMRCSAMRSAASRCCRIRSASSVLAVTWGPGVRGAETTRGAMGAGFTELPARTGGPTSDGSRRSGAAFLGVNSAEILGSSFLMPSLSRQVPWAIAELFFALS